MAEERIAGRYAVTGLLGEGGMGRVVRARDEKLERDVAVKLLAAHALGDAKARERMLREARAVAKLEHPGIVHVYDVGETEDGGAYLVMELVRGETLRARVERGPLPAGEAVRVIASCARALAFAHRAGAVHRDIKPDNVMIREDGRVVLLDFGIAKSTVASAPTLTDQGAVVGTPAYLSPEQAQGHAVDARADQFALAITLHEVLTGRLPWKGSSSIAVIAAMLRDAPEPASALRPGLPGALDEVIARALAKAPEDRFPDLDAFADALEAIALPPEANDAVPAVAPNARAVATRDGSPSAAFADTQPTPLQLAKTELAPAVTGTTPRRRSRAPYAIAAALVVGAAAIAATVATRRHAPADPVASSAPVATDSGPKVVRIVDLPAPPTSNAEAAKAYAEGMRALHEDAYGDALERFERAATLDPNMAAAHLRLSMAAAGSGMPERKRAEYKLAAAQRANLSPRDQALLDALEPVLGATHPDPAEAARRLEPLSAKDPLDVELLGLIATQRYGTPESLAAAERALALDPEDGYSWEAKGSALFVMGRFDDARAAYDRCAALSVRSADCLLWRGLVARTMGRCEDFERDLERASDRSPFFTPFLVGAMASTGKAVPALREVAKRGVAGEPDEDRPILAAAFDTLFAIHEGDFAAARTLARKEAAVVASSPHAAAEYGPHYAYALRLAQIALEVGDDAGARAVAAEFVSRRDAWAREPSFSRGLDLGLELGRLAASGADLEPARRAWIDARRTDGAYGPQIWPYAWAVPAHDRASAEAALATLADAGSPSTAPSLVPEVSLPDTGIPDADIGRTYLLADKVDEAIPYLRRAVASCSAFTSPFAHVHASRDLGRALELAGDAKGACAAYGSVIARWGHAKPRSVTADEARARRSALACAP